MVGWARTSRNCAGNFCHPFPAAGVSRALSEVEGVVEGSVPPVAAVYDRRASLRGSGRSLSGAGSENGLSSLFF
jgi:hypothetical protein